MGLSTEHQPSPSLWLAGAEHTESNRTISAMNSTLSVYAVCCCAIYAEPPSVVYKIRWLDLGVSVPLWFKCLEVGAALARSSSWVNGPRKHGSYKERHV